MSEALKEAIYQDHHPYDSPELISVEIVTMDLPDYLEWVEDTVNHDKIAVRLSYSFIQLIVAATIRCRNTISLTSNNQEFLTVDQAFNFSSDVDGKE